MSEAQRSQIYHRFYQADSGRDWKSSGLGLGLPIAHGLVHTTGGFMNILSEEGKGTRVQITIPQGAGDESPCMALRSPASRNVLSSFCLTETTIHYNSVIPDTPAPGVNTADGSTRSVGDS